jgi:hypothetical protein
MRMNRSADYQGFLRHLPVDGFLRSALLRYGCCPEDDFVWIRHDTAVREAIREQIEERSDARNRAAMVAVFEAASALASAPGGRAMIDAVQGDGEALTALSLLANDHQRALWLRMERPVLFEAALQAQYFDDHAGWVQQHQLGVACPVDRGNDALQQLEQAVSAYLGQQSGHAACTAWLTDLNGEDAVQLTVYGTDAAADAVSYSVVYSETTGLAQSFAAGGAACHAMLIAAFVEHLLHAAVDAVAVEEAVDTCRD